MNFRDDYRRLLRIGGLSIWAAVGVPVVLITSLRPVRRPDLYVAWVIALAVFAAAFWRATSPRRTRKRPGLALAAIQAGAVLALMALPPCFGLEGALFVVIALQTGALLPKGSARLWIGAQSAAMFISIPLARPRRRASQKARDRAGPARKPASRRFSRATAIRSSWPWMGRP